MVAQPPQADQLLAHGKQLLFDQGASPALADLEKALELYRKGGNRRGEAITTGYIGYGYRIVGDYPKALQYLQKALEMKRRLGDRQEQGRTMVNMGLVYYDQGDYREAIREYAEALALARLVGDRQIEGAALNNLGLCHDELGNFDQSLDEYQQALVIHRSSKFVRGESDVLGNLGGRCLLLGRYRDALRYYQQALVLDEKQNLKPSMSLDLGNMALCYAGLGRTAESQATFDRALALARETGQKKEESDWHKGKGSALLRSGRYDGALDEYRIAMQVYEQAGLQPQLAEALQDLGNLHALLGDVASAESEFRRAQAISQKIGNPRATTLSLISLGGIERRRKRYTRADALYREAIGIARQSDSRELLAAGLVQLALTDLDLGHFDEAVQDARQALHVARANSMRVLEAEALYALGDAERYAGRLAASLQDLSEAARIAQSVGDPDQSWRIGYAQGQVLEALNRPGSALRSYEKAAAVIESIRSQLRADRFRAGYIEDKYQVYISLVRLLLKLGRINQAFHYSEQLRAQSYAALLGNATPRAHSDTEHELRERIRQLQWSIDEENAKTAEDRRGGKVQSYSAELVKAERAYQNVLDDLRAKDPDYAAARSLATLPVAELQRRLPSDAALIEYVVTPGGLVIFVLTSAHLQATDVALKQSDLEGRVELLRDLINRDRTDDWRRPAVGLRRVLVDPVRNPGWLNGIRHLYIVPHGVLHYLPFAALTTSEGRPLIEDVTITYLPAAAALARPSPRQSDVSLLAAAPAVAGLPYAAEEVRVIRESFPSRTEVLLGANASETSFKQKAANYSILHLATHGNFNRLNPLLSSLALQPDQLNDGRLEVHEILELPAAIPPGNAECLRYCSRCRVLCVGSSR